MIAKREHIRSGCVVRAYKTKSGKFISEHNRLGSKVSESRDSKENRNTEQRRLLGVQAPLAFATKCWSCREPVFFYRNRNGGFVLFDRMGKPWPVHPCWKERSSDCLGDLTQELSEFQFDGKTYSQSRTKAPKSRKTDSLSLQGFIDKVMPETFAFPSRPRASTSLFLETQFVSPEDPGTYFSVFVPQALSSRFPRYSLHQIEGKWLKYHGQWYCFLVTHRTINAQAIDSRVSKKFIAHDGCCVFCGSELTSRDPWGFDPKSRAECRICGNSRGSMNVSQFLKYIARCYKRSQG